MKDSYKDHYEKYIPVYEELAICKGGKTVWIPTDEHHGWYNSFLLDDEDSEAWKQGYPNGSRPSILPGDLSPEVDRTAYTTISYAKDEAYKEAYFKETDDGIEWFNDNSQRLPDYGEICAWSLFVDIDIGKDFKQRPLPQEYKDIINKRLELWVQAFSKMIGGDVDNVFVLDSGGGMYVFTPPSALSPIYDYFDQNEINLIFNEIGKRMRSVTGTLNDLICDQDDGPKELFEADKVQNKNRQYKTIGSIHKDLDSVVYPIDPNNIQIKNKTVKSITDEDIDIAKDWAREFTDQYEEYVDDIVNYLFQGRFVEREDMDIDYIDGSDWKEILENWVDKKQASIQSWEKIKKNREKIDKEKLKTDVTQDKEVAREAIRRVNNRKLKKCIVEFVGESNVYEKSNEEMDFFPFWRGESTESGRSAFYDYYEGKARFTDKADGTSRDIVYWVALEMTYDDENYPNIDMLKSPGDELDGKDYSRAIEELRNRGEDIPLLIPEPDKNGLSEWRIIKIGKELGIVDEADIIKSNNREKLKPKAWNKVLERLESEDIKHNCNRNYPYTVEDLEDSLEKAYKNRDSDYIGDPEMAHWESKNINNKNEFEEFMKNVPNYVIIFTYDGKIGGNSIDGFIAATFINVDGKNTKATVNRIEPNPIKNIESIDIYEHLPDIDNKNLDIMDIKIYSI